MTNISRTQIAISGVIGVVVFVALNRFMDRDSASVRAISQRAWLVVALLSGGAYVIFRSRKEDRTHYQASASAEAIARRYRLLGVLAWVFILAAIVIGGRLVLQTIRT